MFGWWREGIIKQFLFIWCVGGSGYCSTDFNIIELTRFIENEQGALTYLCKCSRQYTRGYELKIPLKSFKYLRIYVCQTELISACIGMFTETLYTVQRCPLKLTKLEQQKNNRRALKNSSICDFFIIIQSTNCIKSTSRNVCAPNFGSDLICSKAFSTSSVARCVEIIGIQTGSTLEARLHGFIRSEIVSSMFLFDFSCSILIDCFVIIYLHIVKFCDLLSQF